jgi:hypothetical protein
MKRIKIVLGLLTLTAGAWVVGGACGAGPSPWARDGGVCVPCPTDGGVAAIKEACGVDYCTYRHDVAASCCGRSYSEVKAP